MASRVSIDTGVLIEFIDESGDFHRQAEIVVNSVNSGKLVGLIAHPVFAELYYVSDKLYENLAGGNIRNEDTPAAKSERLIRWLFGSPNFLMPDNSPELALEAGGMKRKYALALTDSYVLADCQN